MSGTPSSTPGARPPLRCDRCGDLLGVYEPLIELLADGAVRSTSLAAERNGSPLATYRHRACHLRIGGTTPPEDPGAAA